MDKETNTGFGKLHIVFVRCIHPVSTSLYFGLCSEVLQAIASSPVAACD